MTTKKGAYDLSRAQTILLGLLDLFGTAGVTSTVFIKLVYLMDWRHYRLYGETLTGFTYKFDHYGPNAEGHAIVDALENFSIEGHVIAFSKPAPDGVARVWCTSNVFDVNKLDLSSDDMIAVHTVKHNYGRMSRDEIVRVTKETAPMQDLKHGDAIVFEQDSLLTDEEIAADPFLQETLAAIDNHSGWIPFEQLRERVAEQD